jgi:hypothetical protein
MAAAVAVLITPQNFPAEADQMRQLGAKVAARDVARDAGLPFLPGAENALSGPEEALKIARSIGFSRIKSDGKQHIILETPMEEPAWKLLAENLPQHLRSRFVYSPKKVTVRGLGVVKPKRVRKGKGIMSSLLKAVAPAIIDGVSNAAKGKVQGMGATKRKAGRPRKGRGGGALFPAGTYGPGD